MGIDINTNTIRFYNMGQYRELAHGIPLGDTNWHYVAYTY
jgi:hypothetical protein